MNTIRYFFTIIFLLAVSSSDVFAMQTNTQPQESFWNILASPVSSFVANVTQYLGSFARQEPIDPVSSDVFAGSSIDVQSPLNNLDTVKSDVEARIISLAARKLALKKEIEGIKDSYKAGKIQKESAKKDLARRNALLKKIESALRHAHTQKRSIGALQYDAQKKLEQAKPKEQSTANEDFDFSVKLQDDERAELEIELALLCDQGQTEDSGCSDQELEDELAML